MALPMPAMTHEVIAKALSTRICAVFDPRVRAALEAQLRMEHKTGTLMFDYSEGTICNLRWEEVRR